MKNKKLFAILTLVCFMFTLMPVAAFAATPLDTDSVKVQDASSNWVESVYVAPSTTTPVAVQTNAAITTGAAFFVEDANGNAVQVKYFTATNANLYFAVPGTYTVYAVVDNTEVVTGTTTELKTLVDAANSLVSNETVAGAVAKIKAQLRNDIVKTPAYVTVEAPEAVYQVLVDSLTSSSVRIKADNGFTTSGSALVTVNLANTANGQKVVGKVPTIVAPGYVNVVPAYANKTVTDVAGNIQYIVTADRAGAFNVVFGYEDAPEVVLAVDAYDNAIANVEVVKESASKINKAQVAGEVETGAFVKFTDTNGTVITTTGSAVGTTAAGFLNGGDEVKVTVVSQPTTSRLTAANIKLATDASVPGASELVITGLSADLKVGTYKVKFALENGDSVTVGFEAAKMGNVVGIRFVDPATTIELNGTDPGFTVVSYDANGIVDTSYSTYSVNFNGKAWNGTNVINEEKYIGSTITVLAKSNDNKFVATTTLEVVDNGLEVVYAKNTAEVGVTTTLTANVLDVKGNKVAATTNSAVSIVVLEKPENAYVYANSAAGYVMGQKNISVTFLGSVAGEYKIQTIVVDDNNVFVSGIETITVGNNEATFDDVVVVSIGANSMIVNDKVVALDVAPFIENSRTMLQFNVLNNFGIDVQWDEATRSVIAEGNGTKVVLTLDSKVAVVNGVETTLDVAPYAVNGRTVVPVGFITGTFGIDNQIIAAADGSVADILFTK